jgi:hypothetical protein
MQPREITPTSDSQPSAPAGGWARRRWAALPIGARWVVAAAAVLAFALAFQGSRPLWEPDEGRYAAGPATSWSRDCTTSTRTSPSRR